MDEREKFWNSEQSKEKDRIAKEKERKKSEAKILDSDRRAREERESQARDAAIKERERKISQIKEKETRVELCKPDDKKKWEEQQILDAKDEEQRQKRAEELRRQRSEEAKQLIGQRSTDARAVFERNSSRGQMNFKKQSSVSNGSHSQPEEVIREETNGKEDAINANEVIGSDPKPVPEDQIVLPPPESFGNDDNRVNQQDQVVPDQLPQPPDVTGAGPGHQPDLIQDVAATKGPGKFFDKLGFGSM